MPALSTISLPRMIIVFRADLPQMTRAKGEVQAAHAAASLTYLMFLAQDRWMMREYFVTLGDLGSAAQTKIVMEVPDLAALTRVHERAVLRSAPCVLIKDAAHTVFKEPTVTCIGIGPVWKTDGNAITRGAKMRI